MASAARPEQAAGAVQRRVSVGRLGKRAYPVRQRPHAHPAIGNLRGVADAIDAKLVEIGLVDGDGLGSFDVLPGALNEVPGFEAAILRVAADDDDARRAARGLAPLGEFHDQRNDRLDARRRQRLVALARGQQHAAVLEALGAVEGDPKIGLRMIDVGRDDLARPQIEAELHRDQHDGEQDAHERHRQGERGRETDCERQASGSSDLFRAGDGVKRRCKAPTKRRLRAAIIPRCWPRKGTLMFKRGLIFPRVRPR